MLSHEQIYYHHRAEVGAVWLFSKISPRRLTIILFYCSAVINFLNHHGHQLQVLYLDGEELTDVSIHAVSGCPVLRCLRVSFSGLLTDRCLLSLKVFKIWFYTTFTDMLPWQCEVFKLDNLFLCYTLFLNSLQKVTSEYRVLIRNEYSPNCYQAHLLKKM